MSIQKATAVGPWVSISTYTDESLETLLSRQNIHVSQFEQGVWGLEQMIKSREYFEFEMLWFITSQKSTTYSARSAPHRRGENDLEVDEMILAVDGESVKSGEPPSEKLVALYHEIEEAVLEAYNYI